MARKIKVVEDTTGATTLKTLNPENAEVGLPHASLHLVLLLLANTLLRIAGGAGGILMGLYLSDAAARGARVDASLVGLVGAVSFGAELVAALPMGILSDAVAPRWLMTGGALLGAVATQLFGMSGRATVFFLSRGMEGVSAAAGGPALLAHLTDATAGRPTLRARVMSFYELAFLVGIALGGVLAGQLWRLFHNGAFAAVASIYLLCALLFFSGASNSRAYGGKAAWEGLGHALRDPYLRSLAPVWLCMNSIVGLWLGPTLTFLFTRKQDAAQLLSGIFAEHPEKIGWLMLWYALIFGIGVTAWSFAIPKLGPARSLTVGLAAMPLVCVGLYALNHSAGFGAPLQWSIGAATAALIMLESGFTPAALSLLAAAVGSHAGTGSAMGIYSVLLSLGAILGSLLAAVLGQLYAVDGLIYATMVLAIIALVLSTQLKEARLEQSAV